MCEQEYKLLATAGESIHWHSNFEKQQYLEKLQMHIL